MEDHDLRKQIEMMRQQQEMNKQLFITQLQSEANASPAQQHHRLQLQKHLQMYLMQQKEHVNFDQFQMLVPNNEMVNAKFKENNQKSATASNAVKRRLQNFVIERQKEKSDGSDMLSSDDCIMDESGNHLQGSSAYQSSLKDKCNFPLRKTASEPNIKLKYRLKKMLSTDHRQSPLTSRYDSKDVKLNLAQKIKQKLSSESMGETSSNTTSKYGNENTSSRVQMKTAHFRNDESSSSFDLHASPSLPNIPFGLAEKPVHSLLSSTDNRLVARTPSLPSPLARIPSQQELSTTLSDNDAVSLAPSHGPIRAPQLARPHKALNRARSAPSSAATSYLQQHLLQKRQAKALKQQLQDERLKSTFHSNQLSLPTAYYNENERNNLSMRIPEDIPIGSPRSDVIRTSSMSKQNTVRISSPPGSTGQQRIVITSPGSDNKPAPLMPFNEESVPNVLCHRALHRTRSSPVTSFMKKLPAYKKYRHTTGIAYSPVMLRHGCACGDDHMENGGRLRAIWSRLVNCGLVGSNGEGVCELTEPRKAMMDEMQLVHTQEHTLRYGTTSLARKELNLRSRLVVLPCGGVGVDNGIDADTVWNELDTVNAARMAVGCTVDLALLVAQHQLKNGFALVRPPGHHAQKDLAMAFCYFNSIAVTSRKLQSSGCVRKVLIIDWDIHHCNGTQSIFYDDPSVLVISLHRYDGGNFFPGTGSPDEAYPASQFVANEFSQPAEAVAREVGSEQGTGFNVNIAFSGGVDPPMGDPEYLAAFQTLVLPIARQFDPDIVLVSAGFSAAAGHSSALGGYTVSPQCFGYLTSLLMDLAGGKVVLVLEGGFELTPLCDCVETCVRTLLDRSGRSKLTNEALTSIPNHSAIKTIKEALLVQGKHWSDLNHSYIAMSHADWLSVSRENETCNALASLSVNNKHKTIKEEIFDNSPSPVAMDDDCAALKVQNNAYHGEKRPSNASQGSASPLLDVVGTSDPPTPRSDEPNSPICSEMS